MIKSTLFSTCALVAVAGTPASAQSIDWAAAVDGDWNVASNWTGSNIPNIISEDAVLGFASMYTVTTVNNFTIGSLTITNPLATLSIGSGRTHTLNNDLVNNGTVLVNTVSSVFNAHLSFGADATISGSGSILLNAIGDPGDAQVLANSFIVTQLAGHTIRGSGNLAGSMGNMGDIIADDPLGSGLQLAGTLSQSATGRAGADEGTLILGNGSVITGGELFTTNGGQIFNNSGTASIGDLTNTGDINLTGSSNFLAMIGDVTNDGVITLNSNNAVFNAHLIFNADASLDGDGEVVLIAPGSSNDAQVFTNGVFNGTIGSDQTLRGSGQIDGRSGGTIINNGTINGDDATPAPLTLFGNHSGNGVYRSDDGLLDLGNGLILDGGTFDSSGTGIVDMISGGTATIVNATNIGEMGIRGQGSFIAITNELINDGNLTINSNANIFNAHLIFNDNAAINGTGTVTMVTAGNTNDAQLFTNDVFNGVIGSSQTVQGSGQIDGRSGGTIINNGTINGNDPLTAPLTLFGNHNGSGGGIYRSDDGLLDLGNGLMLTGGTFESSGIGRVDMISGGTATIGGVTNNGEAGIRGQGSFVALNGTLTNNGTFTINSNTNIFNAHLIAVDDVLIDGNGTVRMISAGDPGDAQFFTDGLFAMTIGQDQTVAGSGRVDGRNDGTIINNGTINGDDPLFSLRLQGNHDGSGGGIYRSDDGVLDLAGGLVLNGGTFDSSGTGTVNKASNGTATISNITNLGEMGIRGEGSFIVLDGPLTNNGNVSINSNANIFNAHLQFGVSTTIDGTGTITMSTAGSQADAQLNVPVDIVGTIGSGQTLLGDGVLNGELNIDGTVDPSGLTRFFDIDVVHLSSSSAMIADLGGLLVNEFDRLLMNGDDSIDLDGTLTVNLDDGYTPTFLDSWSIISGATVNGEFSTTNLPSAPIGQTYRVIYEPDEVFVVLTCDTDYTGDGELNFFDVSKFLGFFSDGDLRADTTGDGSLNFFDISLFLQLYSGGCE
jgi:hypothetical protein